MPERRRLIIGLDPGRQGGMVVDDGFEIHKFIMTGKNRYDIRNWLEDHNNYARARDITINAVIEEVGGFIGESEGGNKKNIASAHTMFTFGESYGELCMALCCLRITYLTVLPAKWQRSYRITRQKGETKPHFKNRLKDKALQLYPEEKITLAVSDAFLIMHYAKGLTW